MEAKESPRFSDEECAKSTSITPRSEVSKANEEGGKRDIRAEAKALLQSIEDQKAEQKERDEEAARIKKEKEDKTSPAAIVKYEVCTAEQAQELVRLKNEILEKQEALGTEHPTTLDLLDEYAELNYTTRSFDIAEEYFRKAWEGRKRAQISYIVEEREEYGPASSIGKVGNTLQVWAMSIFTSQIRLAKTLEELQNFNESRDLYLSTLSGVEHIIQGGVYYDPNSPQIDERLEPIIDGLAIVCHQIGHKNKKYNEALTFYERLQELNITLFGHTDTKTLSCVNRLAMVLRDMNRLSEAEAICVESLGTCTEILGPDHPTTQLSVEIVAFIRHSQGKSQEAEDMFRLALACNERVFGTAHPTTLATVVKIAVLLSDQELWEESEHMHRRALEGYEQYYGEEHILTVDEVQYVGELMLRAEVIPEAEYLFRRGLKSRKILYPGVIGHPKTFDTAHCLAVLVQKQTKWKHDPLIHKRLTETEELYKFALEGRTHHFGEYGDVSIDTSAALADFLFENDRLLEAEGLWKRVLEVRRKKIGDLCVPTAHAAYSLGIILQIQHRFHRGIEIFQLALKGYEAVYGDKEKNHNDDQEEEEDEDNNWVGEHHMITEARGAYENCLKMNAIT
jgi:tetratricopeptide (TPR) repeat protein